ncbi:MAG: efflux RND transporter periplasmic adaptor subunit [Planctomycetales bacterium]|nr:efflux RND transporter periplasmic adaptor subunit [Planctomycetales bacterium]
MRARARLLPLGALLVLAGGPPAAGHEGHGKIALKGGKVEGDRVYLEERARSALGLTTVVAEEAAAVETVTVPARVAVPPDARAVATVRAAGVVRSVRRSPGDEVAAGDVIAVVESPELAALAGEIRAAEAEADLAERTASRLRDLAAAAVPVLDSVEAEIHAAERRSAVDALRLKRALLAGSDPPPPEGDGARNPGHVAVRAPRAGVLLHVDLAPGAAVEPETHLAEVADLSRPWIVGEVPEDRADLVRPGARATFRPAGGGEPLAARVEAVLPTVDPLRRVLGARAVLETAPGGPPGAGGLRPGQRGSLSIVASEAAAAVFLPEAAVARSGMDRIAFLVEREGVYRRVRLAGEPPRRSRVRVRRGVYAGDRVVLAGASQLAALFPPTSFKPTAEALADAGVSLARAEEIPVEEVVVLAGRAGSPPGSLARVAGSVRGVVLEAPVRAGDAVRAGAPVAVLSSLEADLLAVEYRRVVRARPALEDLLRRALELGEGGPRRAVLARTAALLAEGSRAEALRGRLTALGVPPEDLDRVARGEGGSVRVLVPSPIAGLAAEADAAPGAVIGPDATAAVVVAPGSLWVEAVLPDLDRGRVLSALGAAGPTGLSARVRPAAGGPVLAATVRRFRPELEGPAARDVLLVELPDPGPLLRPGMSATVAVVLGTGKRGVAVPLAAVRREGSAAEVFVREGEPIRRVPVVLGRADDRLVEILRGLYPGDEVVVGGVEAVRTGIRSVR